jgi:hypothetical protein
MEADGVDGTLNVLFADEEEIRRLNREFRDKDSVTDVQIQAKAIIAAALIQSRAIDAEGLASLNKDIARHKLVHLRELTERIYAALTSDPTTV